MLGLGKRLNQHKYEELVQGSCLESLSLDEIVDIAINGKGMNYVSNGNNFWNFAGAYYKFIGGSYFVIIIDRDQAVGGYNNSELTLSLKDNTICSNDKNFKKLINSKINEKNFVIEKKL